MPVRPSFSRKKKGGSIPPEAEAFVAGALPAGRRVDEPQPEGRTEGRTKGRMPPAGKTRLNVNIDAMLHRRFKGACAMEGVDMSEVISELLEEWLARPDK